MWRGAIVAQASLGPLTAIPAAERLGSTNVVPALQAGKPVVLRGSYGAGAAKAVHWMLATSFIVNSQGQVTAIVADDPWTGKQVRINPVSKRVVTPAGFPLPNFVVNGFQAITIKAPSAPAALANADAGPTN